MPVSAPSPSGSGITTAFGVSLAVHAFIVFGVGFGVDLTLHAKERALDVVLVNSKSQSRPQDVQAKAQANLDGGGNTDEDRRAATPLPVSPTLRSGDDLIQAQQRVSQLETKSREMLARLKSSKSVSSNQQRNDPLPKAATAVSGLDLADRAMAMAQLEGEIARNMEEYNKRPRKKNIGARVEEYRFAQYVEDWRQKVERIGNLNYPDSARGKLYGNLVLSVIIRADGSVKQISIDRPSGHKVLDQAARRVVELAAPYAVFPADIRRDTDEIEITRTWTFTTADQLKAN